MAAVARFRDDRDWSQFHTPKNLAAAIAIEAAELQERFLWKTDQEITETLADPAGRAGVVEELADVFMFALLMADRLEIDSTSPRQSPASSPTTPGNIRSPSLVGTPANTPNWLLMAALAAAPPLLLRIRMIKLIAAS